MSWYVQDSGYPYLDGVDTAELFTLVMPTPINAWLIAGGGYPYIAHAIPAPLPILTEPYPRWMWKIAVEDNGQTQSTDYPVLLYDRPIIYTPVNQNGYITLHDMHTQQDDFNNNGLFILSPTSCRIVEELNGEYSLTIQHDPDDKLVWRQVLELNVIQCLGQLFDIYRVETTFSGGVGSVTAYARHISYRIANSWLLSASIHAPDGQHALEQIMAASAPLESVNPVQYTVTSDIEMPFDMDYAEITPLEAIMGTGGDSLITAIGGELHRDNFYLSLNQKREGAMDNAFNIRVGYNLTGIKREVDYSDFCSHLYTSDNFGNTYEQKTDTYTSYHVVRSVAFKYEDPDKSRFIRDSKAYFETVQYPHITITVTIKDLKNNPDYEQFAGIERYRVGDRGTVFDERLSINAEMEIIKTVTNGINGEVMEVTFGNTKQYLTRPSKFKNILSKPDDRFMLDQIKSGEAKAIRNWGDASKYTWAEASKFKWSELKGGLQ